MSFLEIEQTIRDEVGIITLARPERLNAYTPDMGVELVAALRGLWGDPKVRAVVVTGAGRGFCAGADRAFAGGETGRSGFRLGEEPFLCGFAEELALAPKPMIAAVNGAAVGIGATMLLPFDLRIASDQASFGFPFAKLGLMPGMGATYLLPRLVGRTAARRILLSGASLGAAQALEIGLANEVVAHDELLPRAMTVAQSLMGKGAGIIASLKRALNGAEHEAVVNAIACELREIGGLAAARRLETSANLDR